MARDFSAFETALLKLESLAPDVQGTVVADALNVLDTVWKKDIMVLADEAIALRLARLVVAHADDTSGLHVYYIRKMLPAHVDAAALSDGGNGDSEVLAKKSMEFFRALSNLSYPADGQPVIGHERPFSDKNSQQRELVNLVLDTFLPVRMDGINTLLQSFKQATDHTLAANMRMEDLEEMDVWLRQVFDRSAKVCGIGRSVIEASIHVGSIVRERKAAFAL